MADKSYQKGITVEIGGNTAPLNKALADVGKQSRDLKTELKQVDKLLQVDPGNTELLAQKQKLLADSVKVTGDRLDVLRQAQEKFIAEGGKVDSAAYRDLQRDVIATEQKLGGLQKESEQTSGALDKAGNSAKEAGDKAAESGRGAEKGTGGWDKFGSAMKTVGGVAVKAVAGLGTAAVGAATGMAAMAMNAAQNADNINTLAKQSGLSVEQIQKFQFATEQIDVSLDTLTGSMAKLTKNMATAQGGTGASAEAFAALGISITDSSGELRNNQDVFNETIKALGGIENSTQRDAYAMQIFGKSAQDLNPLILGGVDALEQLGTQAEEAGLILGEDALNSLNTLTDATDTFKATISGAGNLFSTISAEPMAEVVNEITGYISQITAAFSEGGISGVTDQIGTILSQIVAKITAELPNIINAGLEIIRSLITGLSQSLPEITAAVVEIGGLLLSSLMDMLPELLNMGITLLSELAMGIGQALPELVPQAVQAVLTLAENLVANIDQLVSAALQLITGLAEGLIAALPVLIEKAPGIITSLIGALLQCIPQIVQAGIQLLVSLIANLPEIISQIITAVPEIIGGFTTAFGEYAKDIIALGGDLISGIWQGITDAGSWLWDNLKGFFGGVVDNVKGFLGIHSPSTVFAEIGDNMAAGIGVGFGDELNGVGNNMQSAIGGVGSLTAAEALNAINGGIVSNVGMLNQAVEAIVNQVLQSLQARQMSFQQQGMEMIKRMTAGVNNTASQLTGQVSQMMQQVLTMIGGFQPKFVTTGENMVNGIWQGFQNKQSWLESQVRGMMQSIVAAVESEMDINSPSKVFAEIGGFMAEGLGLGFSEEMRREQERIDGAIPVDFENPRGGKTGELQSTANTGAAENPGIMNVTVNNYSPKSLTEAESAKQTKRALRDLALGVN